MKVLSRLVVSDSLQPPWAVARQAPVFMGFSRHEYWSGLPFPSPGLLPNPGIELGSPALQADSLHSKPSRKPIIVIIIMTIIIIITTATAEAIVSTGINKSSYLNNLANHRLGDL